jgi:hypothetical protein
MEEKRQFMLMSGDAFESIGAAELVKRGERQQRDAESGELAEKWQVKNGGRIFRS